MNHTLGRVSLVVGWLLIGACSATRVGDAAPPAVANDGAAAFGPDELVDDEAPLGRLPADVRPLAYDLELKIDPAAKSFDGAVSIEIAFAKARQHFWIHGQGLRVKQAQLRLADGKVMRVSYSQLTPTGVVRIQLPEAIQPQTARLNLSYQADFDDHLRGLYKVEAQGLPYAFTQFEAVDARRCFPGFDEPAFKTPYRTTLVVREGHHAITTMPPTSERPAGEGFRSIRFAETPPLPTYLLAFAVGEFDIVAAPDIAPTDVRARPIPLRAVAVKGQGKKLAWVLSQTPELLLTLERYFGIAYPFEKLDLIAVPDFGAGAMENVGAITFRDWLLLIDPATASTQQKQGFIYTGMHELAHQWFGNLVTMPWWDDIWLNEAFATWVATRAVHTWDPEMGAKISGLEDILGAVSDDSLMSARQIRQPIESNDDIDNAFDSITYDKGAGVISMFERYVGAEAFQRAVRLYFERFRFGSATADDFLAVVEEASGKPIAPAFRSFLAQPGVPQVAVKLRCDAGGPATVELAQSRYLPVGSGGDRQQTWQIPVCARFGGGRGKSGETHEACWLLTEPQQRFSLPADQGCPTWVMPNADGAGYYRFTLEPEAFARVVAATGSGKLSPTEQLVLADALRAAFAAGTAPAEKVLEGLAAFAAAGERAVALAPVEVLRFTLRHLVDAELLPKARAYAARLYQKAMAGLGFDAKVGQREAQDTQLLRAQLMAFLALEARDPSVRRVVAERARKLFPVKVGAGLAFDAVPRDVLGVTLAVGLQEGGAKRFEAVLEAFKNADDPALRQPLMTALAHVVEPSLASRVRELVLDPATRDNEVFRLLGTHLAQPENLASGWAWFEEHGDAVIARLSSGWAGDTPWLAGNFCSATAAASVRAYFEPRLGKMSGGPRNLAGVLESIALCEARVQAQAASAGAFFSKN